MTFPDIFISAMLLFAVALLIRIYLRVSAWDAANWPDEDDELPRFSVPTSFEYWGHDSYDLVHGEDGEAGEYLHDGE